MILADAFQIRDRATGRYLQCEWVEPARMAYVWHDDAQLAGVWTGDHVYRFLAEPHTWTRDLDGLNLEKVRAPACGCCGGMPRVRVDGRWQLALKRFRYCGRIYWRCEKHVDRNPCCIEGCGRTFAHKSSGERGNEGYHWTIMCGVHWRQAPKFMRDAVARVARLAKRRGWTDQLQNRHHRLWERCHRAIREGRRLDETEINKLFGWEQPTR